MSTEQEARDVKSRYSPELLRQSGVCGVGVEKDDEGNYFIAVHVDTDNAEVRRRLPEQLEGYPVKIIQSGPFRTFARD